MIKKLFLLSPLAAILLSCGGSTAKKAAEQAQQDSVTVQTVKEAYIYGFPLVVMDISRQQMTDGTPGAKGGGMRAAANSFANLSVFPDASFTDVVRPNVDTYYSSAWLDLSKEPVVLSLPDTKGRYYMMPMLDMYTNIFASPGTRTTGNGKGDFLVTGPGWTGQIPAGMKQIEAPTASVWIIGRTQVNSKADGDKVVVPLQKQYKLTPLSAWGKPYTAPKPEPNPSAPKGFPNAVVEQMSLTDYFNYVNKLMATYPAPAADKDVLDKFAAIGVGVGKTFDLSALSPNVQTALANLPKEISAELIKNVFPQKENGWDMLLKVMGTYGTNYAQRAHIAFIGLGANLLEDAIYPLCSVDGDGNQLNGANKYVIHYDKGQMPPANAFWSLTMYDPKGHLVANPLNRYAIGDRSSLKTNADGSVDIYLQNTSPGKDKEANWLPAPTGNFNLALRVYYPKQAMIDGSWKITSVKKVQ